MGQGSRKGTRNQIEVRESIHYSFVPNHRATMEALARAKFTGQEYRMVIALMNQTNGRLAEEAELTSTAWQALTLLSRQHVHSTLQSLLSLNVVGEGEGKYRVNHPNDWNPGVFRPQGVAGRAVEALRSVLHGEKERGNFRWLSRLLRTVRARERPPAIKTVPPEGRSPGRKSVPRRGRNRPSEGTKPSLTGDALGGTTGGDKKRKETSALSDESAARRKSRAAPDPRVKEIFEAMKADFGFSQGGTAIDPIPSYGKEGQAIKRMLARGFTPSDILSAWRGKCKRRGGFVSMVYVNEDILQEMKRGKPEEHPARVEEFDWAGLPDTSLRQRE